MTGDCQAGVRIRQCPQASCGGRPLAAQRVPHPKPEPPIPTNASVPMGRRETAELDETEASRPPARSSNVICLRCTSKPATMSSGASFEFRRLPFRASVSR